MRYRASRQGAGGVEGNDTGGRSCCFLPSLYCMQALMANAAPRGTADAALSGVRGTFGLHGVPFPIQWEHTVQTQVIYSKERIGHTLGSERIQRNNHVVAFLPFRPSCIIDSTRSSTNLRRIGDVPFPPSLAQPHPVLRFSRSDSTPLS